MKAILSKVEKAEYDRNGNHYKDKFGNEVAYLTLHWIGEKDQNDERSVLICSCKLSTLMELSNSTPIDDIKKSYWNVQTFKYKDSIYPTLIGLQKA